VARSSEAGTWRGAALPLAGPSARPASGARGQKAVGRPNPSAPAWWPFFVDLDASYAHLARTDRGHRPEHRPTVRGSSGLDVSEHFGVFAGASGAHLRGGGARSAFEVFTGLRL
jgi:hypothetical protein